MTGFLLILTLALPGQPPADLPVGFLFDERACAIAGAGMERILEEANPGLDAAWTCLKQGEDA